jgi:glycosyltransferase involved in cell wall biosynthesis
MHIAFNGWFWDQPNTGSGQYLRRLLAGLRRADATLRLTLIVPPHHTGAPDDLPPDVAVIRAGGPGGKLGKLWFEQRGFPAAAARLRPDIAHVPYWGPPLASPAPLVVSVLDVIPLALPEYAPGWAGKAYTSLAAAGARGAGHIITISEAAKADIVRYLDLPAESITTTYLGVDDAYHPRLGADNDAAVRRRYDLPDRYIFYIGGFDRRKQVNDLLLAYTYVRQAEGDEIGLVLAGRAPAWGTSVFPDLPKYAEQLGLGGVVRWIGTVDEADKPALYRMAGAMASPTLYEGFNLPVVEAMACGTPVVARDIPVMREIVGDGAYLVEDARRMAGALLALLGQPAFRQTMVNQGLAQATRYQWRKTARETLAVYAHVIEVARRQR